MSEKTTPRDVLTAGGRPLTIGDVVTFSSDLGAINAYINAGRPEPLYPNGCPILTDGPQKDDL